MATRHAVSLSCDFPGCDHTSTAVHGRTAPSTALVRRTARSSGWVYRHGPSSCGFDLCPTHKHEEPGRTFNDRRPPIPGRRPAKNPTRENQQHAN